MPIFRLGPDYLFPPPHLAEDGLLAIGGDLSVARLLLAYRSGIFPWYSDGEPILWWSPDPRMVLFPEEVHVSRRLRRTLKSGRFKITLDADFPEVIRRCALTPRKHERGTWITEEMEMAYVRLHREGHAHSVEAWQEGELAGGLYGVALGACFFGESMFSLQTDASKAAFAVFARHFRRCEGFLIDSQVANPHIRSLGGRDIPRRQYLSLLKKGLALRPNPRIWDPSGFPLSGEE